MKSSAPHSTSEQKANTLWQQFTRVDQKGFWQQYEGLLQATSNDRATSLATSLALQKKMLTRKRYFKSSSDNYIWHIFLSTFGLLIGPIIIYYAICSEEFLLTVICLIPWTLGALGSMWSFHDFEADHKYLYIHKKLCFTRIRFTWSNITSILIAEEIHDEGTSSIIRIQTNKQDREFSYGLPPKTHEKFLRVLKTKVPNTHYKKSRAPKI
ncbi:hypothetical protein BKI52_21680 [marine bacterium AO1-C]|nr:hypothetical protein BKI52_21680 [marine bacterium AO1-C]